MEEEDHFTQTQLPALSAALCSCCNGSKAAAITTLFFSLLSRTHSRFLPLILLSHLVPFIDNNDSFSSSFQQLHMDDIFVNGGCNHH